MINIAIDGTAGSGKSTVAKELAKRLNLKVLDTGAIYRGLACEYKKQFGHDFNIINLKQFIKSTEVKVEFDGDIQIVKVNDFDYTPFLRSEEISLLTSKISVFPEIREKVLDIQRDFASKYDCILEGRDIGTVILPIAEVKIFLTASQEVRAKRRFDESKGKDKNLTFEMVLEDLKTRDYADENREYAPLKPAKDAVFVDNSYLSLEETIQKCQGIILKNLKNI